MGKLEVGGLNVGLSRVIMYFFADWCADKAVYFVGEPHLMDGKPEEMEGRLRICSERGARVAAYVAVQNGGSY
jgi:hypothetical protein